MSNKKHNWIIFACLVGAPVSFYVIGGGLSSLLLDNLRPQYKGTGPGFAAAATWTVFALLSLIASLVFGPLVSYLARNKSNPWIALMGYVVPPVSAFLFCLITTVLAVIFIDKGA